MLRVEYREVTGYQEPPETDKASSKGNVYLRRNIREETDAEGNACWRYEEAFLSAREYEEYLAELENPMLSVIMQQMSEAELATEENAILACEEREQLAQIMSDIELAIAELS